MTFAVAFVVALAGAGGVSRLVTRPSAPAVTVAPAASLSGSAHPVTITDQEPPKSTNAQALAEYAAGLQALHDGSEVTAIRRFQKAVELDPALAAAWVRLASWTYYRSPTAARHAVTQALDHRQVLSERDQGLLDSLTPYLSDPVDVREREARLARLVDARPGDAELVVELGCMRVELGNLAGALELFQRAVALDGRYAHAWMQAGQSLAYLGRSDEALVAFARSTELAPTSTAPLEQIRYLHEQSGQCEQIEGLAKKWIGAHPEEPDGYDILVEALASEGRLRPTLLPVLSQKWSRQSAADRAAAELEDGARLAVLEGDLSGARELAKRLGALLSGEPSEDQRIRAARLLLAIDLETGHVAEAAETATAHLEQAAGWIPHPRGDDYAAALTVTPAALDALHRARRLDDRAYAERRDAFLTRWARKASGWTGYVWFYAWAAPAQTGEQAREALASTAAYEPLPPFRPMSVADALHGKVLFLAGRAGEATPLLEKGASVCRAFADPIGHTLASYWLGRARQLAGDTPAACKAYALVLARWGRARPRSTTAEDVGLRSRQLSCGAPDRSQALPAVGGSSPR